jgi:8-oxo-dGTP pyrophosphatase MutT (NUDIX family)
MRVYWFVLRPETAGALVAVWHEGRVLVVRTSYRRGTTLPAGGIRRGEEPRRAAARELDEEVGIRAAPEALRFVGEVSLRYESRTDHCHLFELRPDAEPRVRIDRREVVWAAWMRLDEALAADPAPPSRAYLERLKAEGGSARETS